MSTQRAREKHESGEGCWGTREQVWGWAPREPALSKVEGSSARSEAHLFPSDYGIEVCLRARKVSKRAKSACQPDSTSHHRNLQLALDILVKRISIEVSPPIQFRIEWADSQGMSPLLGCRPI
jgi:hypothetical protein